MVTKFLVSQSFRNLSVLAVRKSTFGWSNFALGGLWNGEFSLNFQTLEVWLHTIVRMCWCVRNLLFHLPQQLSATAVIITFWRKRKEKLFCIWLWGRGEERGENTPKTRSKANRSKPHQSVRRTASIVLLCYPIFWENSFQNFQNAIRKKDIKFFPPKSVNEKKK